MSSLLQQLHREAVKSDVPDFRTGDTIVVNTKVKEGNKERIQAFKGVVIQRRNHGISETFTVRKLSNGVFVERIFPLHSPLVDSIVVERKGDVRKSRIFYMRGLQGKAARIKERKD
jgi:large subunit ribosomal protein L19